MSEGLVNIELPLRIHECTYQQHIWMKVLELMWQWHGCVWLSRTPPSDANGNGRGHHADTGEQEGQVAHTASV